MNRYYYNDFAVNFISAVLYDTLKMLAILCLFLRGVFLTCLVIGFLCHVLQLVEDEATVVGV